MQVQTLTNHWVLYLCAATAFPFLQLYTISVNQNRKDNGFFVSHYLLIPGLTFIFLPIADIIIGNLAQFLKSWFLHTRQEMAKQKVANNESYDHILHLYVFLQTLVYISSYWHCMKNLQVFSFDFAMFTFSLAITAGISNIYAHELMHKLNKWDVFLARFIMTFIHYTHFATFHVHGHHKFVATPRDPNTALLNETVYHFIPRSALGGFTEAWRIECERLQQSGEETCVWNVYKNKVLQYVCIYISFPICLYLLFGVKVLALHILTTIIAVSLTESINYLEHYGLLRSKLSNGEYEAIKDHHSWDSPSMLSGYFLGSIALHSDHHLHPLKPYDQLTIPANPIVPVYKYDYAIMLFACLIPSLYKSIAHPLLKQREDFLKVGREGSSSISSSSSS